MDNHSFIANEKLILTSSNHIFFYDILPDHLSGRMVSEILVLDDTLPGIVIYLSHMGLSVPLVSSLMM